MTNILNIAFKDLKLLARDPLSLFFIFAFPVGMGLLFGGDLQRVQLGQSGDRAGGRGRGSIRDLPAFRRAVA